MEFITQVFTRIGEIKAKMRSKEAELGGGGKMVKDLNLTFGKVLEGVGSGMRVGKGVEKVDRVDIKGLGIAAEGKGHLTKGHFARSSRGGELDIGKDFAEGLNNLLLNKYNDYKTEDILLKGLEGGGEARAGGKKVDIKY